MDKSTAIKIGYWGIPKGDNTIKELVGIEDFKEEVSQNYVSIVRGRPEGLGAGFYELIIEFISTISIHDMLNLIACGIAYDLIKSGTNEFVLRPFLNAFHRLKSRNIEYDVDISELKFIFQDYEMTVSKICNDSIYDCLGEIFKCLAENYESLKTRKGEFPSFIQIPVFEDPNQEFSRFRVLLDVDEPIQDVDNSGYFGYWGIRYDFEGASRVFDVQRKLIIDEHFLTAEEYSMEWQKAYASGNIS